MAYKLTDMDNRSVFDAAIKSYVCSSEDDIAKLPKFGKVGTQVLNDGYDDTNNAPCGYGSTAIVLGGNVYQLFPNNEWSAL